METLNVIKIGGSVIEDSDMLSQFLRSFAELEGNKILVHGGGSTATVIGKKLGLEAKMVEGRRVTDEKYLDIVTMVYGGLINKQIVAKLQALDCNALGLTGTDGGYMKSTKRPVKNGVDYGFVGDPTETKSEFLNTLLKSEIVPVAAPLTHDGAGQILNTNADNIASTIASAMSTHYQVNLIYAFELTGVFEDIKDPHSLLKEITNNNFASLKASGAIFDGMIPKLENAFSAISKGASSVKIIKYDSIEKLNDSAFDSYTNIHA